MCAFARVTDDAAAVTVVPRLLARRAIVDALGEACWGSTKLALPATLAGRYRDAFTGAVVEAAPGPDGATLSLAQVCAILPVTLWERVA